MYLGKKNVKTDFEIEHLSTEERIMLDKTNSEKYQGVILRVDLKWVDLIFRDSESWKKLYVLLVRPHLENAFQVWCPYLVMDIKALEKVQRRASKIPEKLCRLDYE